MPGRPSGADKKERKEERQAKASHQRRSGNACRQRFKVTESGLDWSHEGSTFKSDA